jgi:hypothetical protein
MAMLHAAANNVVCSPLLELICEQLLYTLPIEQQHP